MKLILEDGTVFEGKSFGAPVTADGEVVFNTGMVGYVESLSDPSYAGQILVLSYPLIGNYGVPERKYFESAKIQAAGLVVAEYSENYSDLDPSYAGQILVLSYPLIGNYGVPERKYFESAKIQAAGLVVAEYSENYSHRDARESLSEWLKRSKVPAITGVDTRALTKKLREHGVMLGCLTNSKSDKGAFTDPNEKNLVARVSIKKPETHGNGLATIILVDCGMKENILRSLMRHETKVVRVPWDFDFTNDKYDGIVISNGPGDPQQCGETIANLKRAMIGGKPILGICLGTQLLALSAGATTYKLKYGHRSQNQPCIDSET